MRRQWRITARAGQLVCDRHGFARWTRAARQARAGSEAESAQNEITRRRSGAHGESPGRAGALFLLSKKVAAIFNRGDDEGTSSRIAQASPKTSTPSTTREQVAAGSARWPATTCARRSPGGQRRGGTRSTTARPTPTSARAEGLQRAVIVDAPSPRIVTKLADLGVSRDHRQTRLGAAAGIERTLRGYLKLHDSSTSQHAVPTSNTCPGTQAM